MPDELEQLLADMEADAVPAAAARDVDDTVHVSADLAIAKLMRCLVDPRWNLQCAGRHDWEARTFEGDVGRGTSAGGAVTALIAVLGYG